VDIFTQSGISLEKSFLNFSVFHKASEIVFLSGHPDCLWLINRQPFHQPAEFLTGQKTGFRSVAWSLETPASIQPFLIEYKAILIVVECLDLSAVPAAEQIQCIGVWIQLICVPNDSHQTIEALSHIGATGNHEDF
jgi:hypothetical protein